MSRITAIVVKLDNGKYRRLKLEKIKSIYTDASYICSGTMEEGEGDVAGPQTDKPDFSPSDAGADTRSATADGGGDDADGNGGPNCFFVDGVWICV